jgi:hypothetical protein
MKPLKVCLACQERHREDGARCRSCEGKRQKARNAARPQYAGTWRATSRRARAAQPWCSICGTPYKLSLDHEHRQVECIRCNSRHRRDPA